MPYLSGHNPELKKQQEVYVKGNGLAVNQDPDYGGLSTDVKPTTGVRPFATYYEFDTKALYIYDGISTWYAG